MKTNWASEYTGDQKKLGTIEVGKLADVVVLGGDYMTVPELEIHTIQPQLTLFDGKPVFIHSAFAQEYNYRPSGVLVSTYRDLVAGRKPASVRSGGG